MVSKFSISGLIENQKLTFALVFLRSSGFLSRGATIPSCHDLIRHDTELKIQYYKIKG